MCVWFSHDIDFRTWNTVILGGLWGLCNLNRYMRNGSYSHTSYDNCPIWMDGELNRRVGGFLTHGHMTRCLQTRVLRNIPPTHEHCKFHAANEGTVPCRVIWKSHLITVKKKTSSSSSSSSSSSWSSSSSSSSSSSYSFNESHHARTSLFGLKAFHFLALAGLKCKHRDSH